MGIVGKVAASAALGSSLSDRARLGVYHARIALANRLPLPPPGTVTAAIRPDGRRVIVGDAGELAVLHAVLVDEEYADDRPPPDVVVDLGANAGFATLFFKRRYPHARVVAVEADPRAYARLVQNVGTLEGVTTFHCAVAAEDGTMPFYCSPLSSIGSSLDRRSPGDEEVPIEALTLSSLLDRSGVAHVDLLKIDVEGAEAAVLPTAPLARITEIVGELHYDRPGVTAAAMRALLDPPFRVEIRELPKSGLAFLRATR